MIYINFIYKGSQVAQKEMLCAYNETNKSQLMRNIDHGVIDKPENYDRIVFTEFELSSDQKTWYE